MSGIPKKIKSTIIHSSKWLSLRLDRIRLHTGIELSDYHVLDFINDSVVIVMVNNKDQICFVQSPRYVTQSVELELPAGAMLENETILEAAHREVLEETGYTLIEHQHVFSFHPSNAYSKQQCHIVIGKCDTDARVKAFDKHEVIEVLWFDREDVLKKLKNNIIKDGHATNALLYYFTF